GDVDHVTQVANDVVDAVAAEETRTEDDADDAALVGDGAQLVVVDVAPVPESAGDSGVRDDGRPLGHRACLEKSLSIDVREIDDAAGRFAALHELLAPPRQAVAVAPPAAVSGKACLVGAEMQDAEVTHATAREVLDAVEVAVERVRAFDAEEGARRAF